MRTPSPIPILPPHERHVSVMLDPKHPLAELLRRDQRYEFDAYVFVFDALRFGQDKMGLGHADEESPEEPLGESFEGAFDEADELEEGEERHVSGAELCHAIQRYAIDQYGLLARNVLQHWGVRATSDFGEIVFNLIDIGQMRKTDNDRREDFDNVYDFSKAFSQESVFAGEYVGDDEDD